VYILIIKILNQKKKKEKESHANSEKAMKPRTSLKVKIIFFISLSLIFYNEFAVYWLNYASWPSSEKLKLNTDAVRLLLIADPQLIGENDEPWYQSWAARWDSDRYLRNTFILANSYIKPNSTIFLGDLFDEGNI